MPEIDIYLVYTMVDRFEGDSVKMTQTATRILTLIMLLERYPRQKAADLAAELGVSVRSLHRYIGGLDDMGIPVYTERGPYGGFSLVRGYKLPPLIFTPEEAVVISLGASLVDEMWGQLYREAAKSALTKLDNLLPEGQRQEVAWARRTLLSSGLQRSNLEVLAPILEQLRQAAHECRQVELVYRGSSQDISTTRLLDPYAMVYRWGWWYVIGYCHRRRQMRIFRLDRIAGLTLLEAHFELKGDFDVRTYIDHEFSAQPGLLMRLRFSPEVASIARANTFTWQEMEEQTDGSIISTLAVPDLTWAASMALSFGPGVTVLEPEEARREVCKWAQAVLKKYPVAPKKGEE